MTFSYDEMVQRNLGFVTGEKQARLRAATVFVCVTGACAAPVAALMRPFVRRCLRRHAT